jgi:hypothetical protein
MIHQQSLPQRCCVSGNGFIMRGPSRFRQSDITRALKAARAAGFKNVRVEIEQNGTLVVIADDRVQTTARDRNEWDEVLGE